MSYRPAGPEGLRLLADFFEQVIGPHECFSFTGTAPEVEDDLRRWADEMEQANDEITKLRDLVDLMGPYQVGLCQCKLDHSGMRPHTELKQCVHWMALGRASL